MRWCPSRRLSIAHHQGGQERRGQRSGAGGVETRWKSCGRSSTKAIQRAPAALSDEARRDLRELHLLTAKPVMYIANVDEGRDWRRITPT